MKTVAPQTPGDCNAEIAALIEVLHKTEQRLEQLTGGEVDSVTSHAGQTFLLQHAQDQLRVAEVTKQAAILNALPANIALLDTQGFIVSVNEAWRRFGDMNAAHAPGHEVGINYLAICDNARGDGSAEARQAAAGIRSVLSRKAKHYSLEYPCHSPTQQRRFVLTVAPLSDEQLNGVVVMHVDVTTEWQSKESLKASETRFRQMAENITDVFWVTSPDSKIMHYVSPGYQSIWGRSPESLYANPHQWMETILPEERDRVSASFASLMGSETKISVEYPIARPDGTVRWVHDRGFQVRDAAGNLVRLTGIVTDITERKLVQEALQRQKTELRVLFDLMPAMIWFKDMDNHILRVNQRAAEAAGKTVHEIEGKPSQEIYPQDAAKFYVDDLEVIRSGLPKLGIVETIPGPDGEPLWVQTDKVPYRNQDGKVIGIVVMAQDITERKRAEAEATRLLSVLEASLNEIYIFDAVTLRFDYVNDCARRNLGYSMEAMRQQTAIDIKPEITEAAFHELIDPLLRHEQQKIVYKTVHQRADRSLYPVEVHLQLVERTGKAVFLAVITDITDRKRAEEALRTSMEEFRTLAESMPQIVWITRADGWNIYFNQHWVDYTGLTLEESLGHGWNKPFHPDDQQRAWDAWQKATATAGTYSIESRLRRADGVYRWWLVRGVPLQDTNGNILKWFGTCTDIHDLKMAELEITRANLALRESERRFGDMLQNVELLSLMLDREASITYCNDYLLRLSGWAREEVIGRSWFELFVAPENTNPIDVFSALLDNSPKAWHYENEIVTRAGERRLIRWNNTVLRSGSGEVIGTASIGEDITEQNLAERRIKRLNRVSAVLSGINTLIVRAQDRNHLFKEACRISVEEGAFKMAWIATLDPQTLDGKIVAWHGGDTDYLHKVSFTARAGTPDSERPASYAVRQVQAVICNDIASDPSMVLREELLSRGHKSAGYFPLTVAGRPVAVLALFSGERDVFDNEEVRLLRELTDDISFALDHFEKQERLTYLAYYDVLTGLANRTLFHERLGQAVIDAKERGHTVALVLIDIERFKTINDTLGRLMGDALLKAMTTRMVESGGDAARLGRLDADHFAVMVVKQQTGEELARLIEQRIAEVFVPPYRIGDSELRVIAKFGIAIFPHNGTDADSLFRNAEAALKNAKSGGERYLFYTQAMNARVAEKLTLENHLRQALENDEFVLHYQPKTNLVSGKLTSAEGLIRWLDPRTGLVPPGQFIPILEETGLINEVGRWALRQAIADYLRWFNAGLPAVRVAVNVSPLQLRHRGFIAEIKAAIGVDVHAAAGLELEITESLIMEDVKHSIESLAAIRDMGITIAIDDFGTGFSSLSYLAKLPVDALKIDRSFVVDMTAGPEGLALVATIINLAHSLKLKVVAEGVETEEQARLLRLLGCDEMQGFLVSKALARDIFETKFLVMPAAG